MSTTLTDLYRKTLEELQVVAAGESADGDDTRIVSEKYAALYQQLAGMDLVGWGPTDDVPDYAALPLTQILAYVCALPFGKNAAGYVQLAALGLTPPSLAEKQLRAQLTRAYVSWPATSEYF